MKSKKEVLAERPEYKTDIMIAANTVKRFKPMKTEDINKLSAERMGKLITLLKPDAPVDLVIDVIKEYSDQQNKELAEALREAVSQIEYLHNKFQKTGTGESVLNRLSGIIQKYDKPTA